MHSQSFRLLAAGLLFLLVVPASLAAQGATGRVEGRIIHAATGRPLAGAQVMVPGTALRAVSEVDGRYGIANVPAGARAITVSHLGYAAKTVTGVQVPAGGAATLDVTLAAEAVAIEGLTVSAAREKGSVSAALDEQRTAAGVVSSITQ